MTKVTILGQVEAAEPKNKIEFKHCLESSGELSIPLTEPDTWNNIILISQKWHATGLDLMFAFTDGDNKNGCLYLGHFNDGIV